MFGVDVSEHNGVVNWDLVKSQIDFAILRIGWIGNKNNHTIDKQFERNYNECKRLGIPVGIYVYCYSSSEETAISGANWVLNNINGKTFEMPIFIDMEDASISGLGKEKLTNICIAFNSKIESAGLYAGVYANRSWFDNSLNKDTIKLKYVTWIAHYGLSGDSAYKGEYDLWQNSESGAVNGINGKVDTNYMYRDLISIITARQSQPQVSSPKKTNEQIADEVIANKWGNGQERRDRLSQAGYNYDEIQKIVNSKLHK